MSDGTGSTAWSFDAVGRPVNSRKTLAGITRQSAYAYNPDGSLNSYGFYDGTTLTYGYDSAGRPASVTDAVGNTYAASPGYNVASQLTSLQHQLTSGSQVLQRVWGIQQPFSAAVDSNVAEWFPGTKPWIQLRNTRAEQRQHLTDHEWDGPYPQPRPVFHL